MSVISLNSIRNIAETVGIAKLSDDISKALAPDVEYRIRDLLQEAINFMKHSKRTTLTTEDFNNALRIRNLETLYGFSLPIENCSSNTETFCKTPIVSPSGETLYYLEDREIDLNQVINAPLPRSPYEVSLGIHWLAIEGVQPAISQNPSLPTVQSGKSTKRKHPLATTAKIKPIVKHVLPKELQIYFENVTSMLLSACRGDDQSLVEKVIDRLSHDSGIQPLVPYFSQFIADEVTSNLRDLPLLLSLMKMTKILLESPHVDIEPYLHQLMPAILTCLVGKRLCENPSEDHWKLRDFSANLIAIVCNRYGDSYQSLQPRIAKTLIDAFKDRSKPLTTHYGAILGLAALGPRVVELLLLPHIEEYCRTIESDMKIDDQSRSVEARKCYEVLLKTTGSYLRYISSISALSPESGTGTIPVRNELNLEKNQQYQTLYEIFGESLLRFIVQDSQDSLPGQLPLTTISIL